MESQSRALKSLNWVTVALMLAASGLVFLYAPQERVMGEVQRVFYFHVAAGWVGGLAFLVTAIAGGIYLGTGRRKWDQVAVASVEIGMVFALINIVSGSIWARPVWNTWWTWDPRLVTATIMELIYAAYLMLRQGIEDPERRARFAAVYGIVGFISVPITFFSIRFFRTIHPVVIGSSDPSAKGDFNMTPPMVQTLIFSVLTFTVLYLDLLWHRLRLERLADKVEQLKLKLVSG